MVGMARYYQVPVGNVGDGPTWIADLHFARQLWSHNHCVWASPHSRPDLGGKEMDDSR
jgi:hypothetical protein